MAAAEKILNDALALDADERAEVAHKLLLSLEPVDFDSDAEEVWADEIRSRLKAVRDGAVSMRNWDEALADIRSVVKSQSHE